MSKEVLNMANDQLHYSEIKEFTIKGQELVGKILSSYEVDLEESDIVELNSISDKLQDIQSNLSKNILHSDSISVNMDNGSAKLFYSERELILNRLRELLDNLLNIFSTSINVTIEYARNFYADICNGIIASCEYEYDVILEQFKHTTPIQLTNQELYFGFTYLNEGQIRTVLGEQSSMNFNKIFNAYKLGYNKFMDALEVVDYERSIGLRIVLASAINQIYSFDSYVRTNLKIDTYLGSSLSDEVNGYNLTEKMLEIKNTNFDDDTIDGLILKFNKFHGLEQLVTPKLLKFIKSISDTIERWNNHEPVDNTTVFYNEGDPSRVKRLVLGIIDDCIRWAINQRIKERFTNESTKVENADKESRPICLPIGKDRLSYPDRIERLKLLPNQKRQILEGLHEQFGHFFECYSGDLISKDEFVYLFSGPISRPETYEAPYYWNSDIKDFAGLLRLLYSGQEHGVDNIILPGKDKDKKKSSEQWSKRKQGLGKDTLSPLDEKIQGVVESVTGERLKNVDYSAQTKSKKTKEGEK